MKITIIILLLSLILLSGCSDNICKILNGEDYVWEIGYDGGCRLKDYNNCECFGTDVIPCLYNQTSMQQFCNEVNEAMKQMLGDKWEQFKDFNDCVTRHQEVMNIKCTKEQQ